MNLIRIAFLIALTVPSVTPQVQTGLALPVEQSVPFGTVAGKLLLLGNYMVFLDEQQPDASFVVARSGIEKLTADATAITVIVREPVRNRTGEVTRLNFRTLAGADPAAVTAWYGSVPPARASQSGAAPAEAADSTYQVRHNHRIGSCNGRLFVTATQLNFESVNEVDHSRRWEYKSIKELENNNPYEIEIKPFTGGGYKLQLEGSGIEPAAFKALVDRVTAARLTR